MKISKFAKLVKNSGYCYVAHVAGSGIWLGTNVAMYRATELPEMEGREQVRTVLDMSEKDFKPVHLVELWPDSLGNVSGMDLSPYAKEQQTEKLKVITAPKGIWCACRQCKEDGELFFYDEGLLLPLMDEIKKSDYVSYTVRRSTNGSLFMVVHDGMDVLGAILPIKIVTKAYLSDLAEFEALCTQQYYRDQEREGDEEDPEEAEQIGMAGVTGEKEP